MPVTHTLATFAAVLGLSALAVAQPQQPAPTPEPVKVEPRPEAGFNHAYLLVLPEKIRPGAPVIVATPTPPTTTDAAELSTAAERMAVNAGPFLGQLSAPILVPVLPRPPVRVEGGTINLYIPALTRAALLADEPALARMDKQVLAMIDDARRRVRQERDIELHEKAIFVGFSAGGHFASRMAVLHPDRVLAAWSGGTGGHPILPLAELEGRRLTYPVGIADLEEVAGEAFDAEAFAQVPIFFAQGGADTNESIRREPGPSDSYAAEQSQLILELLGDTAIERLEKVKAAYAAAGSKAQFKVYPEAGHELTPEIARDLVQFMSEQIETLPPQ